MTEEKLFELVVNTSEAERTVLLDRACATDPALRARIEALLLADATGTFAADDPTADPDPVEAHKSVQAGYKDDARMEKDADLAPLRGREDFKKLLAEMEA